MGLELRVCQYFEGEASREDSYSDGLHDRMVIEGVEGIAG